MIKKLRKWLRKWLGVSDLSSQQYQLERQWEVLSLRANVGMDFHPDDRLGPSWAVVCIDGNPCFVTFARLKSKDAKELYEHLKRCQPARMIMDCPPGTREYFDR